MLGGLLSIIMILLKVKSNECCDDSKCSLFNDEGRCESAWCVWDSGACKERGCEHITTNQTCSRLTWCRWNNNACSNLTSCTVLSVTECPNKYEQNSTNHFFLCIPTDSGCRVAACGDFTNRSACDTAYNVGGIYWGCYWDASDSGSCKATTGCESWPINYCSFRSWNGDYCGLNDAAICVVNSFSCAVHATKDTCISDYYCIWGTSCTNVTSCSEYGEARCTRATASENNGTLCFWTGNSCRVAECSDWNDFPDGCGSMNYDYYLGYGSGHYLLNCTYSDGTCSPLPPPPACSTFSEGSDCDDADRDCYWQSSCSVYGDDSASAASLICVPALFVALLLFLTL